MPPEAAPTGLDAHLRALESLYASAPINALFASTLTLPEAGRSEICFTVAEDVYHAAGAAHGTVYFKKHGKARAEGCWISGRRRVFVAEARIIDSSGEECARGTGTFLRSHIALSGLAGYRSTRNDSSG